MTRQQPGRTSIRNLLEDLVSLPETSDTKPTIPDSEYDSDSRRFSGTHAPDNVSHRHDSECHVRLVGDNSPKAQSDVPDSALWLNVSSTALDDSSHRQPHTNTFAPRQSHGHPSRGGAMRSPGRQPPRSRVQCPRPARGCGDPGSGSRLLMAAVGLKALINS